MFDLNCLTLETKAELVPNDLRLMDPSPEMPITIFVVRFTMLSLDIKFLKGINEGIATLVLLHPILYKNNFGRKYGSWRFLIKLRIFFGGGEQTQWQLEVISDINNN